VCETIDELAVRRGHDAVVGVDVPMGLLDAVDLRPCDRHARTLLRRRRSTIFQPPSRPVLGAETYPAARALVAQLRATHPEARSLSAQAFGLVPKVSEVDSWLLEHPDAQDWLYEAHPELSFRAMHGRPLEESKHARAGRRARLGLICAAFPDARQVIGTTPIPTGQARLHDTLDAYAVLWSALRIARGDHTVLGGERDSRGLIMRIVF
jgi:predicted RNase H-like nuclease